MSAAPAAEYAVETVAESAADSSTAACGVEVVVREGTRADMTHVRDMIQELAEYEGVSADAVQLTVDDLVRDGFTSESPWFFSLVALCEREIVGHALCTRAYSSWTCRAYYIEDLYVRPNARRRGVGRALLGALARRAITDRVTRIDWHVLECNHTARAFYETIGARDLLHTEGRTAMRLDTEYIQRLAHTEGRTAMRLDLEHIERLAHK